MVASLRGDSALRTTSNATMTFTLPARVPGDHLYLFVDAYATFGTTSAAASAWTVPDGWTLNTDLAVTESATVVGRFGVMSRIVPGGGGDGTVVVTNPCNATASQLTVYALCVRDVGGNPSGGVVTSGPSNLADLPVAAVPVVGANSVVVQVAMSVGRLSTRGWTSLAAPYLPDVFSYLASGVHAAEVYVYPTDPRSTDVALQPHSGGPPALNSGADGWYAMFAIVAVPSFPPVQPRALDDLRRLRLGCAEDYRVFITQGDYFTVVAGVGWSDLEWSRVLDESSTATVTLPDRYGGVNCCAHLGGLLPWRFGLRIERDDVLVWCGPVTGITREAEALRVTGSDVMARFQKRLATRDADLPINNDAGLAFAYIVAGSQVDGEQWVVQPPDVVTGFTISRQVLVRDFEMAADILSDIADAAVDYWVGNGVLYMFQPGTGWMYWDGDETVRLEGPYSAAGDLVYGTFTENSFIGLPRWSINGWAQTNTAWVPGPDIGETGARRYWYAVRAESIINDGILDQVETFNLYRPEPEEDIPNSVFQAFADGLVAIRGMGPPIIEGTVLAEGAPIDVHHLRPGSIWQIDIFDACYGQLAGMGRLKRVTVRATKTSEGVTETVEPTVFPLGFEET